MGGSLTEQELVNLRTTERYKNIKNFVETGTYDGASAMLAAKFFDRVFTIEIHQGLYEASVNRIKNRGITNVTCLLGDSANLIGTVAEQVKDGAVFFLDSHYSGEGTGWNNEKHVPLYEELDKILAVKDLGPSIFVIDDVRLWTTEHDPIWSEITNEKIIAKFISTGYNVLGYHVKLDRLYVYV